MPSSQRKQADVTGREQLVHPRGIRRKGDVLQFADMFPNLRLYH